MFGAPLLCLLLSLSISVISAASDFSCIVSDSSKTAYYDLSLLHKEHNWLLHSDLNDIDTSNYSYAFNVCDQAKFVVDPLSPPPQLDWNAICADQHARPSAAYQVYFRIFPNGTQVPVCWSLGTWNQQVAPLPYSDLSKGISLIYTNGTACRNNHPRTFYVTIICDPQGSAEPIQGVHEDTTNKCIYEVIFRSPYGCPRSCPLVAQDGDTPKICAGHGVCGMDETKGPRCFCNNGWNGKGDCSVRDADADPSTCSGVCVGLVFVLILLIVLLIGGSIIYYRVHKLSTMNITFSALTESFAANAGVENRHDDEDELAGDVSLHTKNPIRGDRSGSHTAPTSSDFVVDDLND